MTVWLWAYWPVRNVEREGQHSGNDAKLFSKVVPSAASSARTFAITRTRLDRLVVAHDHQHVRRGRRLLRSGARRPGDPGAEHDQEQESEPSHPGNLTNEC